MGVRYHYFVTYITLTCINCDVFYMTTLLWLVSSS